MSHTADLSALSDDELVAQTRHSRVGDDRAFAELVRRHQRRVHVNCRYLTGSASDADDLTQEVLVKAYFGLSTFEDRAQFSTWLYRIKANHCVNFNAKRARRRHLHVAPDPEAPPPEARVEPVGTSRLEANEEAARIRHVLDGMSETLRVPLMLRDGDHLSYEEIAETLEIGLSAVKMRINRARREFRERYRALHNDSTADADGRTPRRSDHRQTAREAAPTDGVSA